MDPPQPENGWTEKKKKNPARPKGNWNDFGSPLLPYYKNHDKLKAFAKKERLNWKKKKKKKKKKKPLTACLGCLLFKKNIRFTSQLSLPEPGSPGILILWESLEFLEY